MLDPDFPPEAEGEIDGGGVAVRLTAAVTAAAISAMTESTPLLWITAIAPHWPVAAKGSADATVRALPRPTRRPSLSLYRRGKTRIPESLPLSMIFSFRPKFR